MLRGCLHCTRAYFPFFSFIPFLADNIYMYMKHADFIRNTNRKSKSENEIIYFPINIFIDYIVTSYWPYWEVYYFFGSLSFKAFFHLKVLFFEFAFKFELSLRLTAPVEVVKLKMFHAKLKSTLELEWKWIYLLEQKISRSLSTRLLVSIKRALEVFSILEDNFKMCHGVS